MYIYIYIYIHCFLKLKAFWSENRPKAPISKKLSSNNLPSILQERAVMKTYYCTSIYIWKGSNSCPCRFIQVLVSFSISGWWILNSSSIFRCISNKCNLFVKAPKPPQFSFFLAPRWPLFYHGGVDIGLRVCVMAWLNYLFHKFCHLFSTIKNWKFSRLSRWCKQAEWIWLA